MNQLRIGDVAVVNGTGGLVEAINFRTLILRDLAGTVHVFPNGNVITLANLTKEWSAYVFDTGIDYKENADQVIEIMHGVTDELQEDPHFGPLIVRKIEIFDVDKLASDQQGIEIPFPQRSLSFGESSAPFLARLFKTGTAPQ